MEIKVKTIIFEYDKNKIKNFDSELEILILYLCSRGFTNIEIGGQLRVKSANGLRI